MRCRFALALLLNLAFAPAARAEAVTGFYRASWAGLPAATIRLEISGSEDAYCDRIAIETEGLPRWITKFRAIASSEGKVAAEGDAHPSRYDALYDLRKRKHKRLSFRFVASGDAVVAERTPEDTTRKPQLREIDRRNVIDPVAAATAIREHLRRTEPQPGQRFTLPVYDGARRFDVLAEVTEVGRDEIRLRLELHPIAGFKGESSEDQDPDDAPRPVDVAFSGDGRLVPLYLSVHVFFLPLTVRLDHLCPSFESCAAAER
jgi:hypothetical protein